MSKNDTFPFWSDDWMKSQQEYIDSWTKMSDQIGDKFQQKKPDNPWIGALDQWSSLMQNTGESQPFAERMLDQGKAFFQMGDEISSFLNMLNQANKSTNAWQENLQSKMDEIKNAFGSEQNDLTAFWKQPMDGWKNAMGDSTFDPETLFKNFNPKFAQAFSQKQGMEDMINPVYDKINQLLSTPSIGPDREVHEQYQKYTRLWMDYQRTNQEYNQAHNQVGQKAIELLMQKMVALSEQEESLDSMRAVYDLWVDCAEEVYADFAYSDEYQHVYGRMINSLMALKKESSNMIDDTVSSLGLPTSKSFDTVLERLQEMRREIRKLQRAEKHNDEATELRAEIAELRKDLADLKASVATKPVASNAKKAVEKKKATTTRKKVAKKKVASKTTSKG